MSNLTMTSTLAIVRRAEWLALKAAVAKAAKEQAAAEAAMHAARHAVDPYYKQGYTAKERARQAWYDRREAWLAS